MADDYEKVFSALENEVKSKDAERDEKMVKCFRRVFSSPD